MIVGARLPIVKMPIPYNPLGKISTLLTVSRLPNKIPTAAINVRGGGPIGTTVTTRHVVHLTNR